MTRKEAEQMLKEADPKVRELVEYVLSLPDEIIDDTLVIMYAISCKDEEACQLWHMTSYEDFKHAYFSVVSRFQERYTKDILAAIS